MTESTDALPVLYTFRRCPYAMRGRLALARAGIGVELREILLKDKPEAMLAVSSKGTVPVLQLADGRVIDESIDVMRWALSHNDPDGWLTADPALTQQLIDENDGRFKSALDRYKYFTRYPEHNQEHYRAQGEVFLQSLETQLGLHDGKGLVRSGSSLADMAIFPFVRQFAGADSDWFENSDYCLVRRWLKRHTSAPNFARIMKKYPLWFDSDAPIIESWG
jgi:glutathione S-transferase